MSRFAMKSSSSSTACSMFSVFPSPAVPIRVPPLRALSGRAGGTKGGGSRLCTTAMPLRFSMGLFVKFLSTLKGCGHADRSSECCVPCCVRDASSALSAACHGTEGLRPDTLQKREPGPAAGHCTGSRAQRPAMGKSTRAGGNGNDLGLDRGLHVRVLHFDRLHALLHVYDGERLRARPVALAPAEPSAARPRKARESRTQARESCAAPSELTAAPPHAPPARPLLARGTAARRTLTASRQRQRPPR